MNVPFSYSSPTLSVEALKHSIAYKLMFIIGKDPAIANKHEWLNATLFAVRDRLVERWLRAHRRRYRLRSRQSRPCTGVRPVKAPEEMGMTVSCRFLLFCYQERLRSQCLVLRSAGYPLTAPAESPCTRYFWI